MDISGIVDSVTKTLEGINLPANVLPPMLLKCTSLMRPGLSAYKTVSKIIENNSKLGIPTGPNPDGSDNLINAYTYNVVKEIFSALQNDASVQTAIPANSLLVQVLGGNAGGPITAVGSNLLDSIARGIMR